MSVRRSKILTAMFALSVVIVVPSGLASRVVSPAAALNFPQTQVVNPHPMNKVPYVNDGKVLTIAEVGSKVVVAGQFSSVRDLVLKVNLSRTNVFSYDRVTNVIDPLFVPALNNLVNSVSASSDGLSATLVVRRGFDLAVEGGASSADFGDDLVGGLMPYEWFGVVVPMRSPHVDRFGECGYGVETRVT